MYRGSKPKIFPIIITIIVVVVVVAVLVTLVRTLLNQNKSSDDSSQQTSAQTIESKIKDQSSTRSVQWIVRGPIVANENFKSYKIAVSPSSRSFVTYSGYLDTVIDQKTYDNNTAAYKQFTYALVKAGIDSSKNATTDDDITGVCATKGLAYVLQTLDGDNADTTLWTSTCKNSPGTLSADTLKVQALFVNQIPDFKPLFNNIF